MKKIAAAILGIAVGSALFAAENQKDADNKLQMYVKAEIGYSSGWAGVKTDFGYLPQKTTYVFGVSGFEITPAFGITLPAAIQQKFGTMKFGIEAQVPVVIGKSNYLLNRDGNGFVIKPGAMFIFNYYFPESLPEGLRKLNAHVGTGFSIPITVVSGTYTYYDYEYGQYGLSTGTKETKTSYSGTGVGFCWDFLLGVQYDFTDHISAVIDWNLGFYSGISSAIRAGAIWRF